MNSFPSPYCPRSFLIYLLSSSHNTSTSLNLILPQPMENRPNVFGENTAR